MRKHIDQMTEAEAMVAPGAEATERDGQNGIAVGGHFFPLLDEEEEASAFMVALAKWGPGVLGSVKDTCSGCRQ